MGGFVPMGAAFTVAGLLLTLRTLLFLQRAETVPGRVVELSPHSGGTRTVYSPTVEYTTAAGTHRVTSASRSSHPSARVGDVMPVKFNPARPDKGRLATPMNLWGLGGLFLFLGVTFLIAGLA